MHVTTKAYQRHLQNAVVEAGITGELDLSKAHEANETTLFQIWSKAITRLFEAFCPAKKQEFEALGEHERRRYFRSDTLHSFERFRDAFLTRFRQHANIVLQ